MQISESQYKFNLAVDMIYYLMNMLLYNHPNKVEMISHLIDKWDVRQSKNLLNIQRIEAKKLAEQESIETDVATIIVSAHQAEIHILKRDFKEAIKKVLVNNIMQEINKK